MKDLFCEPTPNSTKLFDKVVYPFHYLFGSILRAFKTIVRLAGPQYSGSD
jgi:hypothetical protein